MFYLSLAKYFLFKCELVLRIVRPSVASAPSERLTGRSWDFSAGCRTLPWLAWGRCTPRWRARPVRPSPAAPASCASGSRWWSWAYRPGRPRRRPGVFLREGRESIKIDSLNKWNSIGLTIPTRTGTGHGLRSSVKVINIRGCMAVAIVYSR